MEQGVAKLFCIHQGISQSTRGFHNARPSARGVCLNLPIIALVLYGQPSLALGRPGGNAVSWALAASGLFAAFHGFHLRGDEAFRLPFSLTLLAATFVLSVAQALGLRLLKDGDADDHTKGEI